jgi:hypothetical protein
MESHPFANAIPLNPREAHQWNMIHKSRVRGLGEWWELLGNLKWGFVSFLGEYPDWVITFRGKSYHLGVRNSNETNGGDPLEFNGLHRVGVTPITWYTHAKVVLFSETLLLIQSPAWKQLV